MRRLTHKTIIRLFLIAIAIIPASAQAQLACNIAGKWTDSFGYPWVINPGGLTGTFTIIDSQPSPCFDVPLPVTIRVTGSHTFVATAVLPPTPDQACAPTWVDTLTINSACTAATGTFATGINSGTMGWTGAGTPVNPLKCDASAGITPQLQGAASPALPTPWQADEYDSSSYTIGQKGCALTSLSMALEGAGMTVNPRLLNQLLDTYGGYKTQTSASGVTTANVSWAKAVSIANQYLPGSSGTKKFSSLGGFKSGAAASAALDTQVCVNSLPVVVGVNINNATNSPGHFVLVTGELANGDFSISDPYYGNTLLSQYGSNFQTRGVVTDPVNLSFLEISGGSNLELEAVDPSQNITGFDATNAVVLQNIPQSAYFVDSENTINADGTTTVDNTSFHSVEIREPVAGAYLLVVHGSSPGAYTVSINGSSQGGIAKTPITLSGKALSGSLQSYRITYSPEDGVPIAAAAIIGDLNGDGVVNCADLAMIKASFGKKAGQVGFDIRTDVNGDGVVNILDLSAEARLMPSGTVCN